MENFGHQDGRPRLKWPLKGAGTLRQLSTDNFGAALQTSKEMVLENPNISSRIMLHGERQKRGKKEGKRGHIVRMYNVLCDCVVKTSEDWTALSLPDVVPLEAPVALITASTAPVQCYWFSEAMVR